MDSIQYKDSLMLLEACVTAYLFYKDFMSNNETFMIATIIYSLQGFHIHYEMYTMIRKLEFLLSLFSYFTWFFYLFKRRLWETI
jgi:hypothetical protein